MDVNRQQSDLVCSCEGTDNSRGGSWLQNASISPCGNVLYLCDSDGFGSAIDIRMKNASGDSAAGAAGSSQRKGRSAGSATTSSGSGANVQTKPLWRHRLHPKKVNTIYANPQHAMSHYLCTASLDRSVRLWDVRAMRAAADIDDVIEPFSTLPDELSVNSASWGPAGDRIVSVSQKNYLRLYHQPHHLAEGGAKSKVLSTIDPTHSARHDNKTGRYLPVFHAAWDPKTDHAFVVGSMSQPRQVEVYTTEGGSHTRRIMSLQSPDYLGSVQSRSAFHPSLDVLVCGNASGRVHVFR
jgi:WD40 repeat protein